jgi:type I restriction enzyme R subunit
VKPDPVAVEFAPRCGCLTAIADCIRTVSEPPDISSIMQGIQSLLDESISAEPFKIWQMTTACGQIDLSKINFEALRKRFESKKPSNTDIERLKAAVKAQLERMVRLNPTRADYLEKFQELIESYNSGSRNIEETFKELRALTAILSDEQMRHVRENMPEEEQTIFDILTRPAPELTTEERDQVKKVAHMLLEKLHKLLVLGWRQKITTRARVKIEIENALDEGLPRAYSREIYESKCSAVFEHVYQSYQGDGQNIYAA